MATLTPPPPGSPPTTSKSASGQHGQSRRSPSDTTIMSNARASHIPSTSRAPYTAGSRADPTPATTHSSTNTPSTPTLNQPVNTQPADPLRDPKPLLGCQLQPTIHEYEHFPRSPPYYVAAQHVMSNFGDAMYKTKHTWKTMTLKTMRLSDYASLVKSRFAMCSTIGAPPEPAIVVECPNRILSRVKKVLQSRNMKNQYAAGVTPGLAFAVYYCGRDDIAFELRWCKSTVTLNGPEQSLSLCGTRMSSIQDIKTPPSGDATVACLLEVKGDLYALGPAHLLTRKNAAKSQEQLLAELLQMDEDKDEGIAWEEDEDNDSDYEESDGGYASAKDIISDKDMLNSNTTPPDSLSPSPREGTHDPRDEGVTVLFPGPDDLQDDNADGDWAVALIQKPEQQLPNLYSVEQQVSVQGSPKQEAPKLRHIVDFASEPSKDDTEPIVERSVHILTSSSTKQGKLLPGFANISGLSGRGHCNVHIVAIDESDGIVAGDSGSLVVDAQTSLAYGHVVATNSQGYAYVVPLYTTIRQMKAFFGTANVRLPEPLHLLSRVALHYVATKHFCQAEEAIIACTDLVQDICNSRQWERLAHWIRSSTARTNLLDIWDDKLAQLFSDKYENQSIRKWLTVTHAFRERFRAENLSVDEYRFTPHPKPFYDFASAVLPQILEELSAPYNTTLRSCRTCRHSRYDICVITPLLNSGPDGMTSNSSIIKAIITQLLSALNVTSSSRFTRRSELRRRFPFTGYSNGLQNLAVVLDIHLTLTVACSQIDLHRTNIVPFNERLEFLEPLTKGTLASVYRATSWCADAKGKIEIAIKKVSKSTTTVVQWLNEERILNQLQTYNDPHIVELLTSYCTLDSYALVFPLANGNMDQLMERDIRASSLELTATWVVKQIQGLAKALQYLHTGDEHKKLFGRHGDIKPSNILWYDDGDAEANGIPPLGTLKIADFGRSELRSLGQRRPSIRKALCEETRLHCVDYSYGTYAAPECELPTSVCPDRRTSDIWSLGCVFLEFLIWTVEGAKEVRRLHQKLRSDVPGRRMSFWHLEVSTHQLLFSLNPPIKEYLERLSQYTKDNVKLRAAVDLLVYGGVLDPNPHERPTAKQLGEELRSISIETVHGHTVAKRPVWTRLWTYTLGYPPQHRHTRIRNGYDSNIVFGTLLLPYPNMAGAAFLENENTIDSEHYQDMDNESLLHAYDSDLESSSSCNLDSKRTCPYCPLEARPVALKAHARAVHRNHTIHECPDCKELFADMKQLRRHQRQLGLRCLSASIVDSEDPFGREPQLCSRLARTDSATSLRGQHVFDDTSIRSSGLSTEYPTQMRSGGLAHSYHHQDDAGGPYVE